MVSLAFEVTVQDYEVFCLHNGNAGGRRARRLRDHAVFLLMAIVGLTAYYAASGVLDRWSDVPLLYGMPLGLGVACLLGLEGLRPWFTRLAIRRLIGRAPHEAFLGHMRLDATADGLTVAAETSTTQVTWAAIAHVEETASHIFLMLGAASGIIIPKRDQPEATLGALRALRLAAVSAAATLKG